MRQPILLACLALALLGSAPARAQTKTWTTTPDFNTGTLNNVSDTKFANEIVLGPTAVSQKHVVWATNFDYGLVLRLDSVTGKQTGRYDSALVTINGQWTGARPANQLCNWGVSPASGNCPQYGAVDADGNLWIVNVAYGNQGTLTEIAGDITHCIDRNNNGVIDTSTDKNGDGIIDMNPANGEYFGQSDECIVTTIPVPPTGVNALPRAVAIDKWGKVWVATYNEGKVYRFNPGPPAVLEAVQTIGNNPFGLATGGDYLFAAGNGTLVTRVHITTLAVDTAPCPAVYGIVADPGGQVAWAGSYAAGTSGIYRADFSVTPHTCTLMGNSANGASTGLTLDTQPVPGPYVWAADYLTEEVSKYTEAGGYLASYAGGTVAGGESHAHGLSVDFQGNLWLNGFGALNQYFLSKLSPAGVVTGTYWIGFLGGGTQNGEFPHVGGLYDDPATPFLLGDFTGVQLDRQAPYAHLGSWNATYDGGANAIPWSKITWNVEPQGAVPVSTTLAVSARAADTLAALGSASYLPVTSGGPLSGVVGRYVEVNVNLTGPGWLTAVLSDVTVSGPCLVPGDSCCVLDTDCNDGNSCTTDTCPAPGGSCTHTPVANCCNTSADCDDGNACTTDACPTAGGSCTYLPVAGCCNSNLDCDDMNPCTADICSGAGGACSHPIITGCCLTNIDCSKGNVCSSATCPTPGGFCQGGMIPGCCLQDSDCTDNDLCTKDTCNTSTSTCANAPIAGCCNADADCDDGDACTTDHCTGLGGTCQHTEVANCCSATDPRIGTPCDVPVAPLNHSPCQAGTWQCAAAALICQGAVTPSIETCNGIDDDCDGVTDGPNTCPAGETCVSAQCVASAGNCLTDADCDDSDPCTTDSCSFPGGTCAHAAIPLCCKTSADCAGEDCVAGWCRSFPDAGQVEADASEPGLDAATVEIDAATLEADAATMPPDAAAILADAAITQADAAAGGMDAAVSVGDAGTTESAAGCSCDASGRAQPFGASLLLLALLAFAARRRRPAGVPARA